MNTIISNNISENKNRVINAVMSDSQLAKHVTDCEIKQYCLYAYTDTNRNTFGKAMQRVLDAHGEWFAFAAFFGGQKPYICFDLTGEAYHLLNDTVAETSSEITDGAKKESFGKMFIYRLYIKWKWMQQRFERIGDMKRAAYCFYHRLRLTKLYIYQPGWRIMDYGDMKPIFFPRQRIK